MLRNTLRLLMMSLYFDPLKLLYFCYEVLSNLVRLTPMFPSSVGV
ncbi:hypothetical protein Hanom_Chr08g00733301 [Helianthus anomalus]